MQGSSLALIVFTTHLSAYLFLYRFISEKIYRYSNRTHCRTKRNLVLFIPLTLIFLSSFLRVIHYDGWGGRSFDYTFWEAFNRILEKSQEPTS